jgi:hypothetical protein
MRGFAAPVVRQFSIFLENRVGKLLDLLQFFDDSQQVRIVAINVLEASDYAVVRFIPDSNDSARRLLRERSLAYSEVNLVVVELDDERTLSSVCGHLLAAELNILFIYPLMCSGLDGQTRLAISVDDNTLAGQVLLRKGYRMLGESDLT